MRRMTIISNTTKSIVSGALILALLVSVCPSNVFAATSTRDKIKQAEDLKAKTELAKEAVDDKREGLKDQKEELQNYLDKLNSDLADISQNLEEIEEQIASKQDEIAAVNEEIENAKKDERKQYELMKQRVRFMYEQGDTTMFEAFLTADSYSDFLNKTEFVGKTEEYDAKMYQILISLRENVENKKVSLKREEDKLKLLRDQAKLEEEKVNSMVKSTTGSIAKTAGAISASELETAAYEAELKQQEENLASLKNQLVEEQAMSAKAAKMAWRDISEITFEEGDRDLLACLIYCEAGNQPYEGQVAVGAVVINRIRSAAYPNTMVGVIYQKSQFSPVGSGRLATRLTLGANEQCYQAADEAMSGATPVGSCLYFRTVLPEINGQIIGNHVFY